jgi:hypothetical protein
VRARPVPMASMVARVIEVVCDACGWMAVTSQGPNIVWVEHALACPAVGGAVRLVPEVTPLHRFLGPVNLCTHRLVRRQIAVTAAGVKRYGIICELCGRRPLAA